MNKFRVFVYMLMRDASLKQRIPCIMRISIFGAFSAGKKCALYTGKYGTAACKSLLKMSVFWRHRYQVQRTIWQSLKTKMICSRPFPAEEFAVTVISLAITGTIAVELHVTLTLNVN